MAYIGNSPGVASQRIVTTFTATASQTTFTPSSGYTVGYLDVYHNGVKLINGDDYTASNGTTFVLASGAASGDVIEAVAYLPRGLSDGYTKAEADARYMDINAVTLPTQTGQSGKYLTTDGSAASWGTVDLSTKVSKTGDTMTGDLNVTGTSGIRKALIQNTGSTSGDYAILQLQQGAGSYWQAFVGANNNVLNFGVSGVGDFLKIDSSGRVTMPYQPAFYAVSSSSDTDISGNTVGAFDVTRINIGGYYNTSTKTFTAPVSGTYYFEAVFQIRGASATQQHALGVRLDKNGSIYKDQYHGNLGGSSEYVSVNCTCLMALSAGDTVISRITPGTTINVEYTGGTDRCHFAGYLIG
jgi:hypothetical protein